MQIRIKQLKLIIVSTIVFGLLYINSMVGQTTQNWQIIVPEKLQQEEAIKGFETCLELQDEEIEIFVALADVQSFTGDFNDALNTLFKAQKLYKDFAEIEYRLAGLFLTLNKENYGITHLINGMKIDYDYHTVLKEVFPSVFDIEKVQKLLNDYKKATE